MRSGDGHGRPYTLPTARVVQDPSMRLKIHGRIKPMDDRPGFFQRLFRR